MQSKLTWRDVEKACARYNAAKAFNHYNSIGRLSFGDVAGMGGPFKPRLWVVINDKGGVCRKPELQGATHRQTIALIDAAANDDKAALDRAYQMKPYRGKW